MRFWKFLFAVLNCKIAKLRAANAISNTFQNHNLIRRNSEAVTTRRSWKPFGPKPRGFESLFLRHKNEHHPSWMVFIFISQSEGTNSRSRSETGSSHTAGTEQISRHKAFAVSASRGDIGLNLCRSGTVSTILAPSSIPLFQATAISLFWQFWNQQGQ